MDATAVMPIDGNVTIRVLCRNRRLLLSAEANPQFGYKLTMASLLVPWDGIQQMSMCHRDLQRAMIACPFGPVRIIPEDCILIHILLTCALWRYDLWLSREYLLIVFSVRAVYPVVRSRTLPARTRHDPTSWMMQGDIRCSYKLRIVMSWTVTVGYTESLLIAVSKKPALSTFRHASVMESLDDCRLGTRVGVVIWAPVLSHLN